MEILFKLLHIASVLVAFGMLVVPGVILSMAARTGDVEHIRSVFRAVMPVGKTGGKIVLAAGLLGVATAIADGFPLLSSWLVAAYVLFFFGMALGAGYLGPHHGRIYALAMASPVDRPSPELVCAIQTKTYLWIVLANWAVWAALVYDMVCKPAVW